jgi:hypothetical protein
MTVECLSVIVKPGREGMVPLVMLSHGKKLIYLGLEIIVGIREWFWVTA